MQSICEYILRLSNVYAGHFNNLAFLFYYRICLAYASYITYNFIYLLNTLKFYKKKISFVYALHMHKAQRG